MKWKKIGVAFLLSVIATAIGAVITGSPDSLLLGILVFYLELRRSED